jgi:hypothetical protein
VVLVVRVVVVVVGRVVVVVVVLVDEFDPPFPFEGWPPASLFLLQPEMLVIADGH